MAGTSGAKTALRAFCPAMTKNCPPSGLATAGEHAPDEQDDHGADDRADETRGLVGLIPADGLPEIGRDEGAADAEQRGEDEALRLIGPMPDQLGDHAGDKPD